MNYKKLYRRSRRLVRGRGIDPVTRKAEARKEAFFGRRDHYIMSGRKWKRRKGHWPREQPPRSTTKQDLRKEKP